MGRRRPTSQDFSPVLLPRHIEAPKSKPFGTVIGAEGLFAFALQATGPANPPHAFDLVLPGHPLE